MAVAPGKRKAPTRPDEARVAKLAKLTELHDQFVEAAAEAAGFNPKGRPKKTDYNVHHVDLDADPAALDAFHAAAGGALAVSRHLPGRHNQKSHGRRRITGFGRIAGADLGQVSDRQLLRVFAEESESDNPDIAALERLFEEMGAREEAARVRHNPIRRLNLQTRSEEDLYRLWNEHANAPAAVAAVQAELDRRRDAERDERNRPVVSWDEHAADTPEQRQIDRLVARGRSYREAYAETYGLSDDQLAAQERLGLVDLERRAGETRRQAVRRAYGEHVHLQYLQAEAATRGHLLSAEGRRAGVDPVSLFSGPASRARRYASEDLLRWFAENRRVTYTEFAQQVLTGRSDERFALAGNDRDFGV